MRTQYDPSQNETELTEAHDYQALSAAKVYEKQAQAAVTETDHADVNEPVEISETAETMEAAEPSIKPELLAKTAILPAHSSSDLQDVDLNSPPSVIIHSDACEHGYSFFSGNLKNLVADEPEIFIEDQSKTTDNGQKLHHKSCCRIL